MPAGFNFFEKMKCIFSIAPVENLGKSWECFSLRNTHVDAVHRGTGRWPLGSGVLSVLGLIRVEHRTHCTGCRVFPVHASGLACL